MEALGQTPPWSADLVAPLCHRITAEFSHAVNSDWWPRVSLVLQQPRRRSTQRLLETISQKPSRQHLHTLIQHLQQRCRDDRMLVAHRVYRFVIRLLRHGAGLRSLAIDPDGWMPVELLLQNINQRALHFELWRDWTIKDLQRQVELHGGRRLQLNNTGDAIRVRYGHTISDICAGKHLAPPNVLYHGTSQEQAVQIMQHGLKRRERNLVHLTSNLHYAARIAGTHENSVVLQVNTDAATSERIPFWQCNDHVWQCTDLPASAIEAIRAKSIPQEKKGL